MDEVRAMRTGRNRQHAAKTSPNRRVQLADDKGQIIAEASLASDPNDPNHPRHSVLLAPN
jgi:hypothetical protein